LLTLTGLAAAFGVASCCALPLLLATAGLGTAWLGGIALLAAPHRPFLLAASTLCLLGGAVLLWRQRTVTACAPGALCARPGVRGLTLAGLLLGLVLLYLGYAYA
jgi:mercuric ion transport protein